MGNVDINDLTYNTTHTWDGFARTTEDNDQDIFTYLDYLTPIGDKNHLDWIVSNLYGMKIRPSSDDLDDDAEYAVWDKSGIIGPADRYALIKLERGLAQTVAAPTRKKKDQNGYIIDQDAPDTPGEGATLDRICVPVGFPVQDIQFGEFVNVYRESMLGTYLCNIRHDVIPYGGYSYQDRCLNTYSSYGDFVKVDGESNVS